MNRICNGEKCNKTHFIKMLLNFIEYFSFTCDFFDFLLFSCTYDFFSFTFDFAGNSLKNCDIFVKLLIDVPDQRTLKEQAREGIRDHLLYQPYIFFQSQGFKPLIWIGQECPCTSYPHQVAPTAELSC